ncbi:unnamed protein product [Discosporangium mesarthrocarpum]
MDLGTINKKVTKEQYNNLDEFSADVQLTFDNAMLYNNPEGEVYPVAEKMKKQFINDWNLVRG